jgi:Rrf2 family protein
MKFTALEEYGLRCLLQLARREVEARPKERAPDPGFTVTQEGGTPEIPISQTRASETQAPETPINASITIGEIAEQEGLTQQYAGKIFRILAKAGLVESERGRHGGYHLTRPPEQISLSETLAALGGRMFERGLCERYTGDRRFCVHTSDCAIRSLWSEVQWMIDRLLLNTTLSDLISPETTAREKIHARSEDLGLLSVPVFSKRKEGS